MCTLLGFPHALVMTFLFSKQPLPAKIKAIIRATFTHAKNLAKFVSIYKVVLLLQRYLGGRKSNPGAGAAAAAAGPATRERSLDTFVAGLIGGWIVFGERNAINEQVTATGRRPDLLQAPSTADSIAVSLQIVLYVSSRVMAAFLPRLIASAPGPISNGNAHAAAAASTSAMSAASSSSGGSWLGSLLSNTPLEPLSQPLPELTSRAANPRPIPPADLPFSIFAAVMWGAVMYLYRHRGERLQPGMVNSMGEQASLSRIFATDPAGDR